MNNDPATSKMLLVQPDFGEIDLAGRAEEFGLLAKSTGAEVVGLLRAKRVRPDAAMFLGKGKVDEVAQLVESSRATLVALNAELTPTQQRNLELRLGARVIDRTALVLDIFAQRAHSHEGKLQVELAQLEYLSSRLVRGWSHLERQRGGIGLRGPGEKQLELDRRMLARRVSSLKEQIERIASQRMLRRRRRAKVQQLTIAMVGYTNSGKTTLFNALTRSNAYAADQLFATLDTTSRKTYLYDQTSVILSDTVGFVRDLPHSLVTAFHATLEETAAADLLIHVVDSSSPDRDMQIESVEAVLREIGAANVPKLLALNKTDLSLMGAGSERDGCGNINKVWLSAKTGAGIDAVRLAMTEFTRGMMAKFDELYDAGQNIPIPSQP